jgi:hypothetical protein
MDSSPVAVKNFTIATHGHMSLMRHLKEAHVKTPPEGGELI